MTFEAAERHRDASQLEQRGVARPSDDLHPRRARTVPAGARRHEPDQHRAEEEQARDAAVLDEQFSQTNAVR